MFPELLRSFARIHILYHAGQSPVYGLWLMEELARHGYDLSPGTLYPILHRMEGDGLLTAEKRLVGGRWRTYYHLTPAGRATLDQVRARLRELTDEVLSQ